MDHKILWPENKCCGAMVTIELDCEFIWYSMGESYRTPKNQSMGIYGMKRGLGRILDSLERFGVRATFFIPGIAAEDYPDQIREIALRGHEIALHGYAHENFAELTAEKQLQMIQRGRERLEQLTGKRIVGFRLPEGDCTTETMRLLEQEGFLYDNSMFNHDIPYRSEGEKLVEIPMRWELQDFPYLALGPTFPAGKSRIASYDQVLDNWLWELDACCDMGFCYVITFDPQIIGSPGRMFMFDRILEELTQRNIWIATGEEMAGVVGHQNEKVKGQ